MSRSELVAIILSGMFLAVPALGLAPSVADDAPRQIEERPEKSHTHSSSSMNEPGFQEGSIFTGTTIEASIDYWSCGIDDDSSLKCWGENEYGTLGIGTTTDHYTPQTVDLGTGRTAVSVSAGDFHACAILDDGSLKCWGRNLYGQLGTGDNTDYNTPQPVDLGTNRIAVAISAGSGHTCVILDDASLKCWGANHDGELGLGNTTNQNSPVSVNLGSGRTAVAISLGQDHTCAVLEDASVKCWGEGDYGRLGQGESGQGPSDHDTPQLVSLPTGRTAVAISAGQHHTCAILDNASVSCWGRNNVGQLGNGGTTGSGSYETTAQYVDLGAGRTAVSISTGSDSSCSVLDNGVVKCWGNNNQGQIGDGTTVDRNTPTATSSLGSGRTAKTVSIGYLHTCAILDDASLSCWGDNAIGQLGTGDTTDRTTPTAISIGSGQHMDLPERDIDGDGTLNIFDTHMKSYAITDAGASHTCAILDDDSLYCWGRNSEGQLGDGTNTQRSAPVAVSLPSGRTAISVSAGNGLHTCAILDDASAYCWGYNNKGQLGDGTTTSSSTPVAVSLPSGRTASSVTAGYQHTCAFLDNASLYCWGDNTYGRLGDGTTTDSSTPVAVSLPSGRTATSVSAANYHTCAVLDDASAYCWGWNPQGQLGDGTTTDSSTPVTVSLPSGRTAVSVSARGWHSCAVLDDASVYCWGRNSDGQLGDGTTTDSSTPVTVSLPSGRTAVSISAGRRDTCAFLDNASLYCWGDNTYGQLGDGTTTDSSTPVAVSLPSGQTAVSVSAGGTDSAGHTCAVLGDLSMYCWGHNYFGNLGDGTTTDSTTPVAVSLPVGRTTLQLDMDLDGDGVVDTNDDYPSNPVRSISCSAGSYGRYVCVDSSAGHSAPTGSMYDVECSAGTYQPSTGQTSCIDASVGYYVASTASTSQTACAAGTYQASTGQSSCTDASAGYYVPSTGSATQTACAAGTYQPSTGQTSCTDASAGYYVEDVNPKVSGGMWHSCSIVNNGSVYCWGWNNEGQIGDGTGGAVHNYRYNPTIVSLPSGRTATEIDLGEDSSCAILDDDSLYCWGEGWGTSPVAVSLPAGRSAVSIAVGGANGLLSVIDGLVCSVLDNSSLYCFTSSSQITLSFPSGVSPVSVYGGEKGHMCALTDQGSVFCWGQNSYGELGDNSTTSSSSPVEAQLPSGAYARHVSADNEHTCAIMEDGSMYCWGYNGYGQIGDGTTTNRHTPTAVLLPSGVTAANASTSNRHTCAIMSNNSTYCWGNDNSNRLGDGSGLSYHQPIATVDFPSGMYAVSVDSGPQHTCTVMNDDTIYCWGVGASGQLGYGTPNSYENGPIQANLAVVQVGSPSQTACAAGTYQPNTGQPSCIDASTGYYVASTGSTSQTPCAAGTYEPRIGQASCTDASAGHYVLSTASTTQTACAAGTYQPSTGQSSCTDASAGYYVASTGSSSQAACATGTYQPSTGQTSCIDASAGYYVDSTAATTQTACAAGTYQPSTGQSSCTDASAGYYVASTGSSSQAACSAGTYQPSTGRTSCDDADVGYYVPSPASTSQTACSVGTYQNQTGQSSCVDAFFGHYVDMTAATNQTACAAGTYQPSTGQTSCIDASAGHYVSSTGSASQTACALGTYQPSTGQSSCIYANTGNYVNTTAATSQTPCSPGTYQPNTGQTSCIDADAGYWVSGSAAGYQDECSIGTYQPNTGQTSCIDASAGHYVNTTAATNQTACSGGTYQPSTGQTSCIDASAGHYVSSTSATNQTACSGGTYQPNTGQASCLDAEAGYYVPSTGSATQTPCSPGTYQPYTGQASCLIANPGHYVDTAAATSQTASSAGYYVPNSGASSQDPCPAGTYQPSTGQTSCIDASAGYYVNTTASMDQTACDFGTFQNQTGQSACIDAPAGTFVNTTAATSPTDCFAGTYQPYTGQSSCLDAPVGTFVDSAGAITATDCPVGTYQPYTGQTSCLDADAGYHVPSPGASNQTACGPGTYQPNTGQSSCNDAPSGTFVNTTAATSPTDCPIGTYQPSTGQTSCLDADAGYHVPSPGASNQTACGPGTFQNLTGQSACTDSPEGHFVNSTAATSPTPCPVGSYQPYTGQVSCLLASPGNYVDNPGSPSQTPCPAGTYNPLNGSSSLDACIDSGIGHYVPNEGSSSQTECSAGTFQNVTGQISCNDADPGFYVPSSASWFQVGCTAGTYQPNSGQTSCIDASPGHYVPEHASPEQTSCETGSYQPSSGQVGCIPASIGFYVDAIASVNQTACPPGNSTTGTGSTSISDCYVDTDDDGVPDITDPDDDNDGYLDFEDDFPLDNTEWLDTDGDGIGNNADTDDDDDGWTDDEEIACGASDPLNSSNPLDPLSTPDDYDGDWICDEQDPDDDNDLVLDVNDAFPLDECATIDTDGDGLPDWIYFNCNTTLTEDDDDDNDGWNDTVDMFPQDSSEWEDYDLDGIGNNADTDDDGDTVPDYFDAFPLDETEWNDNDGDGVGDNADTDDDNDGTPDTEDDFPNDAASDTDTDGDGMPDSLPEDYNGTLTEDNDDDGDGVLDIYDEFPLDPTEWLDTDGDGIGNNADPDDDNDGWSDSDEYICGTDTMDDTDVPPDSDNDGICDSEDDSTTGMAFIVEIILGNPLVAALSLLALVVLVLQINSRTRSSESRNPEHGTVFEEDDLIGL